MNSMYMTTSTQTAKVEKCDCSECRGECCTLECPTKPNFFCGQVLTDEDLKALVDWTSAKSALQRFRHGWGVSCGLEVNCSHDPKQPARVIVEPGYAIDFCGRDIVVCEPIYYDFKCEKPFDPCCPPPRKVEENPDSTAKAETKLACIPPEELRAFDLCLNFAEKQSGGRRALARGNCKPLDECQFTRIIETGSLSAREVLDPCGKLTERPGQKYYDGLSAFIKELYSYTTPESLREWVHGKLHSFCFVEDCLCPPPPQSRDNTSIADYKKGKKQPQPQSTNLSTELMDELRFYIVQDWRNNHFQCLCKSCEDNSCEGDGVPLARVWLWNKNDKDCKICRVAQIDAYPPYRRLLGRDCWPSDPRCIDLSRYIWSDVDGVRNELSRKFSIEEKLFTVAETKGLGQFATDTICAPIGSNLVLRTYKDICQRDRVVCFTAG